MVYLLTTLHVIFCVFLILAILLQTGKGGGMGSAFGGGGSSTVFGPRGPGSFIAKLTGGVAVLFMLTSMTLAYISSSKASAIEDKVAALDTSDERTGNEVDVDALKEKKAAEEAAAKPAESPADAGPAAKEAADAGPAVQAQPAPTPEPKPADQPAPLP